MMDRIIYVDYRSGRHPYVIYLLAYITIAGGLYLGGVDPPASVAGEVHPIWAIKVWGFGLLMGGLVSLVGVFGRWKSPIHGLQIERAGKAQIAMSTSLWIAAVLSANGRASIVGAFFIGVFIIPSLWRILTINREIKKFRMIREEVIRDNMDNIYRIANNSNMDKNGSR